jgi:hypothetical protein
MRLEVDHQTRETFEGALSFGRATLEELGFPAADVGKVVDDVRRRDIARLLMQREEGLQAGADLLHGARIAPAPLTSPKARARALSDETRDILGDDGASRGDDAPGLVGGEALP